MSNDSNFTTTIAKSGGVQPSAATGQRVMLVEDEAVVALMTAQFISDIGFVPVGPFHTVAEAMADARNAMIDIAVLDVNLQGELVYPIAEVLAGRKVPILFMSGYGSESIDPRFSSAPVLSKPIQLGELQEALMRACEKAVI